MRKFALVLCSIFVAATASAAWTSRAPLPAARCTASSGFAHVNGAIHVVNGFHHDRYDIAANSWATRASSPRTNPLTNLNSNAVLGTEIYFLGGTTVLGGFDVGSMDKYNAATNTWTLNIGFFIPNAAPGTIPLGGSIYAFGGTLGGEATLAYRITPPSTSVFVFGSMPTGRVRPAVVEHGGKIWAIGGMSASVLTAVEIFDPFLGTWTAGPSLPVVGRTRAAGVVGGDIHALLDQGVYRLSGGTWTQVGPPPPFLGFNYGAIFVGSDIYAAGGCATNLFVYTVASDTIPPVIASATASPSVLNVPNHKMVPVTLNVIAADNADPAPVTQIVSVTSNEPDNGLGDGDMPNDIVITGPLTVQLRAERSGKGTGRTYTITVSATDASGNSSSAIVKVVVPRGK